MRKSRLAEFMKTKRIELTDAQFKRSSVPNPFLTKGEDMTDFVRNRGVRQGLDKVSRSKRGPDSGVNGSRYDDMVRDIDDLEDYLDAFDDLDPEFNQKFDDDDLYLSKKDPSYRRNEFNDEFDIDDFDAEAGWQFMRQLASEDDQDDMEEPEMGMDEPEGMEEPEMGMEEPEDSRYEGVVRAVKGAYLVSKEKQEDGTFKEVWMYNVGSKYDDEANIRKAILSGTDIDPTKNFSEDGSQEAVLKSVGNVQFLTVHGLPD